jgi:hypothetical protein
VSEDLTGTLGHALAPFLEYPLESIIDDRVQLVRVSLDKCQVNYGDLALARGRTILFLPLVLVTSRRVSIPVSHQSFRALNILQRLPEIVLPAHPFVSFLLDELQRPQAKTAVLVRFAEQPDGLAFSAQTADSLFVGDVEGNAGIWRRRASWETTLWSRSGTGAGQ